MKMLDLLEIVEGLNHFCKGIRASHWDRVTISSQLVYRDFPRNLALGIKPGFAPDKFSIDMRDSNNPLILTSVEVGEKCKAGDFIRIVKKMEDVVSQRVGKSFSQDELLLYDTEVFFIINDIFGLFDGKKPIKYMEIDGFEYTETF